MTAGDVALRLRDRLLRSGDTASAAAVWAGLAGLVLWAILAERQLFVVGIVVGSVLALGAIGLTLVYGVLRFANFAHGDMMTLGAYVALAAYASGGEIGALSFGYGMIPALGAAAIAVALFAVITEGMVYRVLRRRGSGVAIFAIASFGVALMLRAIVLLVWGPAPKLYDPGVHFARDVFGVKISPDQMFIVSSALAVITLTHLLLYRTKLGKAMRAMADNPELARIAGIHTGRVVLATWCISATLSAFAGVLLGVQTQMTPDMGFSLIIPMFAATILGGIGSPQGALIGAFVVAVAQETSTAVDLPFPPGWGPGYKPAVAFLILIAMLILRPQGLFGRRS